MSAPEPKGKAEDMSKLAQSLSLRGVTLPNRVMVSPMCTYSAHDGLASDWHLVHLGKFALGGAAAVFTEAAAVEPRGRITHGDLGIWSAAHAEALKPVTDFLRRNGALPAIQIAHENISDAGLPNVRETDVHRTDWGWFNWILEIFSTRTAHVRGTWGYSGEEIPDRR